MFPVALRPRASKRRRLLAVLPTTGAGILLAGFLMAAMPTPLRPETGREDPDQAAILAAAAADVVLLGEATHGTSEFYTERARITEGLAQDARTAAVVIEADGTEVARANRYVRGIGPDPSAAVALSDFRRFPRWMWRNQELAEFVERLRATNLRRPESARIGLYGMDVYDLYGALDRGRAFLRVHGGRSLAAADAAAKCFAPHRRSTEAYGTAARKPARSCAAAAQSLLDAVTATPSAIDLAASEAHFEARQAAAAVVDGEAYFRAAFAGSYSWNVRERAMAGVIERVAQHATSARHHPARIVVWTHNSHAAKAASTTLVDQGETTLADLLRHGDARQVFSLGLLTHSGTFMAASAWNRPGQIFRLTPAARNSAEGLLYRAGGARTLLMLPGSTAAFAEWRPQRMVGAVFDAANPEAVYARAQLSTQFDAVLFAAETRAVTPLP